MIPDVNVLVAAFRRDHEHHVVATTWLNDARNACTRGDGTLVLPPMVVAGFLRVVTNHRVFIDPDPVQDAIAFVDALLDTPGAAICPSGHEWPVLRNKENKDSHAVRRARGEVPEDRHRRRRESPPNTPTKPTTKTQHQSAVAGDAHVSLPSSDRA